MRPCPTPPARNHRWRRVPHHNRQEIRRRTTSRPQKRLLVANQNLPSTSQGLCPSPHSNLSVPLHYQYSHPHPCRSHFNLGIRGLSCLSVSHVVCVRGEPACSLCSKYALYVLYAAMPCTRHRRPSGERLWLRLLQDPQLSLRFTWVPSSTPNILAQPPDSPDTTFQYPLFNGPFLRLCLPPSCPRFGNHSLAAEYLLERLGLRKSIRRNGHLPAHSGTFGHK